MSSALESEKELESPPSFRRLAVWRKLLPLGVSLVLLAVVFLRVSPSDLVESAALLNWVPLIIATAALVLLLYSWDCVSLRWLFSQPEPPLSYPAVMNARGRSYLWMAFNYGLGQAFLAWNLSRAQGTSLLAAAGRCSLLVLHDAWVLLVFGFAGSLLSDDPRLLRVRLLCGIGIVVFIGLFLAGRFMAASWRDRLRQSQRGAWLADWNMGRSGRLCVLRGVYYVIILAYATIALGICGVFLDYRVIWGVIPVVVLVDGLPISISGLGTRENTLLALLESEEQALLLAVCLVWTGGLILGRTAIGLVHWWVVPLLTRRAAADSTG